MSDDLHVSVGRLSDESVRRSPPPTNPPRESRNTLPLTLRVATALVVRAR